MLKRLQLFTQDAINLSTRRLAFGMQDATPAVGILRPKNQLAPVTLSPGNQFLNELWSFFQQQFDRGNIAQTISAIERVLQMQADIVFVTQPRGLALGIDRAEIGDFLLVENQNTSGCGQIDRGTQSRDTGANDNVIGVGWQTLHKPKEYYH